MRRPFALVAAVALLAACSSDPTTGPEGIVDEPDGGASGTDGGALKTDGASGTDAGADVAKQPPPVPSGCITDVSAGTHKYTCEGFPVDARIPAACDQPGCGLILELHGDTGTGLLIEAHLKLFELGAANNYIVIAPTGPAYGGGQPGSTWSQTNDAALIAITKKFQSVFRVDDKKIHATGFSRGGFVNWRLLCDASDLFASVAPAAAGSGGPNGEVTCFAQGRAPTRRADILFLMGKTDVPVPYSSMVSIRDAAIASYDATNPVIVASDTKYTHNRWTNPQGVVIETFDHSYETVSPGPWASAKGHCVPGSTMDPQAPQYAVPCKLPNAFTWGDEVMKFFLAHPKK
jgi:poly(3-hydroxybutyrate) depolymerase